MGWRAILSCVLLAVTHVGCGDDSDKTSCPAGAEGCACFPNATCNVDLSCRSALCVNLGVSGASGASGSPESGGTGAVPGSGGASTGGGAGGIFGGVSGAGGAAGTGMPVCVQACGDRECGPDPECGASCGNCGAGLECSAGVCRSPQPLKLNGETCASGPECASGFCGPNQVGELHCYGTSGPNGFCDVTFDCNGGACFDRTLEGTDGICVQAISVCADLGEVGTCVQDLAIASCQRDQSCGADRSDFDWCVGFSCQYWHDNPPMTGCPSQLDYTVNTAPCP